MVRSSAVAIALVAFAMGVTGFVLPSPALQQQRAPCRRLAAMDDYRETDHDGGFPNPMDNDVVDKVKGAAADAANFVKDAASKAKGAADDTAAKAKDAADSTAAKAKGAAGDVTDKAKSVVGDVTAKAKGATGDVTAKAKGAASDATAKAKGAVGGARESEFPDPAGGTIKNSKWKASRFRADPDRKEGETAVRSFVGGLENAPEPEQE